MVPSGWRKSCTRFASTFSDSVRTNWRMAVLGGITSIAQRRIRAKIFYNIFENAKPTVRNTSMTLTRNPVAAPRLGFVEEKIGISDKASGSSGAVPGSEEIPCRE